MHTTARTFTRFALGTLLAAMLPISARAQVYDLSWNTIDGGGALFTIGGAFELSGTIGQPDAGSFAQPMTGGAFELVGGFWPVVAGCACAGDLNGDCNVDITDLASMLSAFGCCERQSCYSAAADINRDGCVDLTDLATLLSNFGTTCR